ncbi:MAG: MFS transporter [Clostridia bacterium]|nr:MFS transporter [Clostridia bacterium]
MRQELRSEKTGKILYLTCWLAYMLSYVGRMNYSAALICMIEDGVFNKAESGMIGTMFFIFCGAGQLVMSLLVSRMSSWKMLGIGLFGSALCNAMMYFGSSYYAVMLIFWGLNGVMNAMIWPPIFHIISYTLPRSQRQKACLTISIGAPAGSIVAYLVSTVIMENLHYMAVFIVPAFMLLAIGLLWVVVSIYTKRVLKKEAAMLPDEKVVPVEEVTQKGAPTEDGYQMHLIPLLLASGVVFLIPAILIQGMLATGIATWVPAMITEVYKVSPTVSLLLTILITLTNLMGIYLGTYLSEKVFHDEVKAMAVQFAIAVLPIAVLYFIGVLPVLLCIVLLCIATTLMVGVNQLGVTLVPMRLAPFGQAVACMGFLNTLSYVGTAIANYGFGALAESFGWNVTILFWAGFAALGIVSSVLTFWRWKPFFKKMGNKA